MVFLDANVVLEIILKDRLNSNRTIKFLDGINDDTALSVLSVHLIMHFGRKERIGDALLESVIGENELLSTTPEGYVWLQ
jgi:hypothetical protein